MRVFDEPVHALCAVLHNPYLDHYRYCRRSTGGHQIGTADL